MELKASEFGVVLSVDALKLSRQSPLGIGIGGGGGGGCGSSGGQGGVVAAVETVAAAEVVRISDTLVPTTYLVDTTLSDASDYDQTVHAVRLPLYVH